MARPISSSFSQRSWDFGRGDSPPPALRSWPSGHGHGESGSYQVTMRVELRALLALELLRRLLDGAEPGGFFARRALWRFGGDTKAAAPGTASSVRPSRAFGARPRADGGRFGWTMAGGGTRGDQAGRPKTESMLTSRVMMERGSELDLTWPGLGSGPEARQERISSSAMGVAPRGRKGEEPRERQRRRTAAAMTRRPTTPRTTERMMIRSRCWLDIGAATRVGYRSRSERERGAAARPLNTWLRAVNTEDGATVRSEDG
jgi:hypothetical protein